MVELELLKSLHAIGVKAFKSFGGEGFEVEFFEHAPGISRLDADTLIPPAPEGATEPRVAKVPPALDRLLKRGSVS